MSNCYAFIIGILTLILTSCNETTEDRINRAVRLQQKGKTEKAVAIYSEIIKKHPEFHFPYFNRGYCYMTLKQYQKAYNDFNKILLLQTHGDFIFTLNPNSPFATEEAKMQIEYNDAFFERAVAMIYMDSIKSAYIDLERLIDKGYPKKALCIMWQGVIWYRADSTKKACQFLMTAKESTSAENERQEIEDNIAYYCK